MVGNTYIAIKCLIFLYEESLIKQEKEVIKNKIRYSQ